MRSDTELPNDAFRGSQHWQVDPITGQVDANMATRYRRGKEQTEDGQMAWHSFSGHERNCLFHNRAGEHFDDVSVLSGADSIADSRSFALLDYDHDGWIDLALVNANKPLFQLFQNRGHPSQRSKQRFLAIQLRGGNTTAQPSAQWSARDAYGARISLELGDRRIMREMRCGDGFAAQNSDTLLIGVGAADQVDHLHVTWPSGNVTAIGGVDTNQLVVVTEVPRDGVSITTKPYVASPPAAVAEYWVGKLPEKVLPEMQSARFHLIITTATWCAACKSYLPQVVRLSESFDRSQIKLWGLPADVIETPDQINEYIGQYQPAYEMLTNVESSQRDHLLAMIRQQTQSDALPSSVLLDADGRILRIIPGVPSVSDVARLMARQTSSNR